MRAATAALFEIESEEERGEPAVKYVSSPVAVPGGISFYVDAPDIPAATVDSIIDVVGRAVDDVDPNASLTVPSVTFPSPSGPYVLLYIVGDPGEDPTEAFESFQSAAINFVAEREEMVIAATVGTAHQVPKSSLGELIAPWVSKGLGYACICRHEGDRYRFARLQTNSLGNRLPIVALAEAGPHLVRELDLRFEELVTVGRAYASGNRWVFADVSMNSWDVLAHEMDFKGLGEPGRHVLHEHPWQRLGPGHLEGVAPIPDSLVETADGAELRLGTLDDWLRASDYGPWAGELSHIVKRARRILRPILRRPTHKRDETASLVLTRWVEVEDPLPEPTRSRFIELARSLSGTAGTPDDEARRRRRIADSMVRRVVPAAVAACGAEELAQRLIDLPDLTQIFDPYEILSLLADDVVPHLQTLDRLGWSARSSESMTLQRLLGTCRGAACSIRGNWDPLEASTAGLLLQPGFDRIEFPAVAAWAPARQAGIFAFLEADRAGRLAFPRESINWWEAKPPHDDEWDLVRDRAAATLMGTSDTDELWRRVVAQGSTEDPAWWEHFDGALRAHFGDRVEIAYSAADAYLAEHIREYRVAAALTPIGELAFVVAAGVVASDPSKAPAALEAAAAELADAIARETPPGSRN